MTPAVWMQLGGTHRPLSPEWILHEAGVPLVGGTHHLVRIREQSAKDGCVNCSSPRSARPAIKRLPDPLPPRSWAYYHSELMHRQGGAALAGQLARAGASVLCYVDTPTPEAVKYVGVLIGAFRRAGCRERLLIWYHRRDCWHRPFVPWHDPAAEATVAELADYLTTALTPLKISRRPENDRFEETWADKLIEARCDPVAALRTLAEWDPAAGPPGLGDMLDAELLAAVLEGRTAELEAAAIEALKHGGG